MFDAIAYHDEGRSVTYKEMLENADRIGKRVEPRSLVLFVATNTGESLEGYLGFLRNRAVVMMAASSIDADSLEALLEAPGFVRLFFRFREIVRKIPFVRNRHDGRSETPFRSRIDAYDFGVDGKQEVRAANL